MSKGIRRQHMQHTSRSAGDQLMDDMIREISHDERAERAAAANAVPSFRILTHEESRAMALRELNRFDYITR